MKILVTGAKGQLGTEVYNQFRHTYELILHDIETLDISDFHAVNAAIGAIRPDIVINTAAYTNVDRAEDEPELAFKANSAGPHNLAIACKNNKAKLIHISTDDVFEGANEVPYQETDHTIPISIYGKSRLLGEKLIQHHEGKYIILRTSWLYGGEHNFVKTMLNLAEHKKEISVVADQFGTPTYTKDLVWVIEALMHSEDYGLYHASNNGFCSWYDFACEIFAITEKNVKLRAIKSAEYPTKVVRPKYVVMDNKLLKIRSYDAMRPWKEALKDYLTAWRTSKLRWPLHNQDYQRIAPGCNNMLYY